MSRFNIAVIQPHTNPPPDDAKNVDDAVKWIERAAGDGADFVCFPESYPGPWRMPASYDPSARIAEAAHKFGIHAVFGTMEPIDDAKKTAYNLTCMAYPDGRNPARYRRTHPNGPWIYSSRTGGGGVWEFEWVPGDAFPVFDTVHGKIGLGMCSEVYMPEVSRALALRGAEIIFLPAGLSGAGNLWETWHTLLRARAIENLALVVSTRNIFDPAAERGLAIIAGPERTHYESINVGMSVVQVSLDRVRELRAGWDGNDKTPFCGTKQGLLSQWQRPELYDSILPRPLSVAAELRQREIPVGGIVTAVSRSPRHSLVKSNEDCIRLVAGIGVEGDAHQGTTVKHRSRVARDPTQPNLRQVHLVHAELHDELREAGFTVAPGQMGENVTTSGVDLLGLAAGTRLHLGSSAVVEVTRLRNPCAQLDKIQKGLMAATLGRDERGNLVRKAGIMGVVLAEGEVRPGDPIRVEPPPPPHRPLAVV